MGPSAAAELNPLLQGFVVERLRAGEADWKIIDALMRQAKLDRPQAAAYLRRLGPPVYRQRCRAYRTHMMIGAGLWALTIGLGVAFYHEGILFVAGGAIIAGMADFAYGWFGWRRNRALLNRGGTVVPN